VAQGVDRHMLVWTEDTLEKMAVDSPGQGFVNISTEFGCTAPYSVVKTPRGVRFFDGTGFSITDGVTVVNTSRFRLDDYMDDINRDRVSLIRGAYLPGRDLCFWSFPKGSDPFNAYGLIMNDQTGDVYPLRWGDVNALWTEKASDGTSKLFSGSSTRHTESGKAWIWEHDLDIGRDGILDEATYTESEDVERWYADTTGDSNAADGYITDFNVETPETNAIVPDQSYIIGSSVSNPETVEPYLHEGCPATLLRKVSDADSTYQEYYFVCKKITVVDTYGGTYGTPKTLTVHVPDDFNIPDGVFSNDYHFFLGCAPMHFGPKWTDFGSPRFFHSVKYLLIDIEPPAQSFYLYTDHYVDGDEDTIVRTNEHIWTTSDNAQIKSRAWVGKCNSYGFRIRVYSPVPLKIHTISTVFDTNA